VSKSTKNFPVTLDQKFKFQFPGIFSGEWNSISGHFQKEDKLIPGVHT